MRSLLLVLLAVVSGCVVASPVSEAVTLESPRLPGDGTVEVGRPYFDFTAPALGGGTLTLSEIASQNVVLLQFWSVTCDPCLEEFPLLAQLHAEYGGIGLQVLGVNIDNGGPQRLQEAMETRGIALPYPVALDPNRSASAPYVPWAVPVTVIVDRSGVVRAVHTGYNPTLSVVIERETRELL